jgi:AsmA-like C-terminal region
LCLLFLLWVALAAFVEWKKDDLLKKAQTEVNSRISGNLKIGHVDISLFRHFPSITLRLTDVTLRDSAWSQHHHDLLQAGDVYVSASLFRSLIKRRVELSTIFLENATVYFYTDTTGYSNTSALKDNKADTSTSRSQKAQADLPAVALANVRFVVDMQNKNKFFGLDIHHLHADINRDDRTLLFDVRTDMQVDSFAFNKDKGSFVKDKPLSGHLSLSYNVASKIVQLGQVNLTIDGNEFTFAGRFFPTVKPDPFFLTITTNHILFRQAVSLLTPKLREKLDRYNIDEPIAVRVQLDAGAADQTEPQIQIQTSLTKGTVHTPSGDFTNASFQKGSFTNEWVHGHPREDENSGIRFTGFSASLENIPLHADTVDITNLKYPQLACDLHSAFDLSVLNEVYGSESLQFQKGSCHMDLRYKGPLSENDTAGATVNGHLDIDSGGIEYLPYKFTLSHAKGRLLFKDQDLVVQHLEARAGTSTVMIKGVAKNLIALLDHNAEDVSMDWTLNAAHLELEDLVSLVGGPVSGGTTRRSTTSLFGATANRIDNFLKNGLVHLNLDAADISYENFSGAHAKADITFHDDEIRLNRMTVEQSLGSLDLKATLSRRAKGYANPLTFESHLQNVDIPKLFTSFDNFGQKAITGQNLKGRMNADIQLTGALNNRAVVVPNSFKGTVNFSITDGELVNFEPMEKIHEKVMKKRDFSQIRFAELQNQLVIDSTTVSLQRMEIRSSVFTLYATGTYDMKTGTDMELEIPLSNLKNKNTDAPPESKGNDSKAGPSVRLRAKTGDDGKLKISWDPFRKGLKKVKKA